MIDAKNRERPGRGASPTVGELLVAVAIIAGSAWITARVLQRFEQRRGNERALAEAQWQQVLRDPSIPALVASDDHDGWNRAMNTILSPAARSQAPVEELSKLLGQQPAPAGSWAPSVTVPVWFDDRSLLWTVDRTLQSGLQMRAMIAADVSEDGTVRELKLECNFLGGTLPDGTAGYCQPFLSLGQRRASTLEYAVGILVGIPLALAILVPRRWRRRATRVARGQPGSDPPGR